MPAYHVERSIRINASSSKIKNVITNFKEWPAWSPWLISEPTARLTFSENQGGAGASYSWKGSLVGEGNMTTTTIDNSRVDMLLRFIKPFKSEATVYFEFIAEGDATRVVWNMDGSFPFFLFFMVKQMKSWIGMDYDRGLSMLKEYIETGSVISQVEIMGINSIPATPYIGISKTCQLKEIGDVMPDCYQQLNTFLVDNNLPTDIIPFALYDYMDKDTQKIRFTAAVPVPENTPSTNSLTYDELPATEALQINHLGRYTHLGNAWSTGISFARYKKIKLQKKPMGFEFYPNDPERVEVDKLEAQVFLPLK